MRFFNQAFRKHGFYAAIIGSLRAIALFNDNGKHFLERVIGLFFSPTVSIGNAVAFIVVYQIIVIGSKITG